MAERAAVLEELEKRFEGVSPGVKDVLTLAKKAEGGPFRQVRGLVADLLRVSVEAAPLVEVALGEIAQYVVVAPGRQLLDYLQAEPYQLAGRVGFLWLADASQTPAGPEVNLEGRSGVLGRADRFVETEPQYEPLARRLLGRTWIVQKLAQAVALAAGDGAGCSFVTLAGEMLAVDGTLAVGPRHPSSGLISRRSELRALRIQLSELEAGVQQVQTAVLRLDQQIAQDQERVDALAA
jgi:chromosome segregation protein